MRRYELLNKLHEAEVMMSKARFLKYQFINQVLTHHKAIIHLNEPNDLIGRHIARDCNINITSVQRSEKTNAYLISGYDIQTGFYMSNCLSSDVDTIADFIKRMLAMGRLFQEGELVIFFDKNGKSKRGIVCTNDYTYYGENKTIDNIVINFVDVCSVESDKLYHKTEKICPHCHGYVCKEHHYENENSYFCTECKMYFHEQDVLDKIEE